MSYFVLNLAFYPRHQCAYHARPVSAHRNVPSLLLLFPLLLLLQSVLGLFASLGIETLDFLGALGTDCSADVVPEGAIKLRVIRLNTS